MVTQYDEKGKFFTQVVTKQPSPVTIRTANHSIRGVIHVRPGSRIKDELNGEEHFIAVTNAVVMNDQGNELFRSSFLVVNRDHIVYIVPEDEIVR